MMRKFAVRTLAGAAAILLVSWSLALPASAKKGPAAAVTVMNIVPAPTTYDANNAPLGAGLSATTSLPTDTGSPDGTMYTCVPKGSPVPGVLNDPTCGGGCLPAQCAVTRCVPGTNQCYWSCGGAQCVPGACVSGPDAGGQCYTPLAGGMCASGLCAVGLCDGGGNPCATNADCAGTPPNTCTLPFPGVGCGPGADCLPTAGPDGLQASDAPVTGAVIDPLKSVCTTTGTKVTFAVGFTSTSIKTPVISGTGGGICQGGDGTQLSGNGWCTVEDPCLYNSAACTAGVCADSGLPCTQGKKGNNCGKCYGNNAEYCGGTGNVLCSVGMGGQESLAHHLCSKGYNVLQACQKAAECLCSPATKKSNVCGYDTTSLLAECTGLGQPLACCTGVGTGNCPMAGLCVDGNEFITSTTGILEQSYSGASGCLEGGCLAANASSGLCLVSTCTGGLRPGLACQGNPDCPGLPSLAIPPGTCNLPASVHMPTKYASFSVPAIGAYVVPLCPFKFRLDYPMEVYNGAGAAAVDWSMNPLGSLLVNKPSIDSVTCQVREPGTANLSSIGMISGGAKSAMGGRPIPDFTMPITAGQTATPSNEGIGAIIGVGGIQ